MSDIRNRLWIANEWVDAQAGATFATMNPASVGGNRARLPPSVLSLFTSVELGQSSRDELKARAV